MGTIRAGMARPLADEGGGTLLNELFAVAEMPERESGGLPYQEISLRTRIGLPLSRRTTEKSHHYISISHIHHSDKKNTHHPRARFFFSTLCDSARSIATVITFCGFSSFTIVVTDVDGETAEEGGGISSLLPESARSSMVEKLLKVDLSRFEDGDMLRTLASSSSSGGGRLGRVWKRNTERSCPAASATSPSTSLLVSSMSCFGTGYRTALSIFTLPSIHRTDRSQSAETDACTGKSVS